MNRADFRWHIANQ
jgi:hypothetical protein